jgi:dUTPase
MKYLGRELLNSNYNLDNTFFTLINTERKAYLLGLIANYLKVNEEQINIKIHKNDIQLIKHLSSVFYHQFTIKEDLENSISLSINSPQMTDDLSRHLNIEKDTIQFPDIQNDQLKWDFTRGYFDGSGFLNITNQDTPQATIYSNYPTILEQVKEFINMPCDIYNNHIKFNSTNSLDFLGRLYKDANIYLHKNYDKFVSTAYWKNKEFRMDTVSPKLPSFRYAKTCEEALPPTKNRLSDSGYDLHLMNKIKEKDGVHYYDTCIRVQPEFGYYFDLVGRSSISKTGWTLANNIGIIDCSYSGSIIVALIKTRENAEELSLPCKLVQIIPRNLILMEAQEVSDLDETERQASGGLGSGQFKNN